MPIPSDYSERVYAGVLGKIIGVYLGRPFEGWYYDRIMKELGEVNYYVNQQLDKPLVVTDDDITGTFTFLQALPDYGNSRDVTAAQIGRTWLNYIIEQRTILWWGGMGNSTEHTAYLRLKDGIEAPRSGSIELNGATVAEQIGAQIFIDGWAMVAPGDPELAAELARRAGSVSHDGEAVYGAQVIAAIEALAFVESDINKLIDAGLRLIPKSSTIYRMINEIRGWHAKESDWHITRKRVDDVYGYAKYPGHVHIVPNHAVVILGLLYGDDDFQKSLMVANTAGWDTDCNSGNVGCIMGIKNGLRGIDAGPDWRGPVADRIFLPTADGGQSITDAVRVAEDIVRIGSALVGSRPPASPKGGARFHFEQPGAVQGFAAIAVPGTSTAVSGSGDGGSYPIVENVMGHSSSGKRSLAIRFRGVAIGRSVSVSTPTFIPPDATETMHYELFATPTIYPGQTLRFRVEADKANNGAVAIVPMLTVYGAGDVVETVHGLKKSIGPGTDCTIEWKLDETRGRPIACVGFLIEASTRVDGSVYLDYLGWDGTPSVDFVRPDGEGTLWRRAWVNAVDHFDARWEDAYTLSQDHGTGLILTGNREWKDYQVTCALATDLAEEFGIAVRARGLLRYYALLLTASKKLLLVKERDGRHVLGTRDFPWELSREYQFALKVSDNRIVGLIDGKELFAIDDEDALLGSGGIGIVCKEGRVATNRVSVRPV